MRGRFMRASVQGQRTYLYVSGLNAECAIRLDQHVELQPVRRSPDPDATPLGLPAVPRPRQPSRPPLPGP
jgi:hypothetical protein